MFYLVYKSIFSTIPQAEWSFSFPIYYFWSWASEYYENVATSFMYIYIFLNSAGFVYRTSNYKLQRKSCTQEKKTHDQIQQK